MRTSRSHHRHVTAVVVAVVLALVATACSDSDGHDDEPAAADTPPGLVGWVIAGHPIAGATVKAVDAEGETIATSDDTSLETGAWYLTLEDPPDDFTLVATGGTDGGQPFDGELRAAVHGYDHSAPRAIHVNPATTLVAADLAEHTDESVEEATERVQAFLELPTTHDLESDVRVLDRWFSGATFMAAAEDAGGFGLLIDDLVSQLDAGQTRSFPPAPHNDDGGEASAGAAAVGGFEDLTAMQALSGVGAVVGIASGIIGIIRGGKQTDALSAIATTVNQIEYQVGMLETDVDTLLKDAGQNGYNASFSEPSNLIAAKMKTVWPLYQQMLAASTGSDAQIQTTINNFVKAIDDPEDSSNTRSLIPLFSGTINGSEGGIPGINADLVKGTGGETGALDIWAKEVIGPVTRFVTVKSQAKAAAALQYWTSLQTQVLAVNLAYEEAINTGAYSGVNPPVPVTVPPPTTTTSVPTDSDCYFHTWGFPCTTQADQDQILSGTTTTTAVPTTTTAAPTTTTTRPPSTTPTTTPWPKVNLNTAQDTRDFAGANAAAVASQCTVDGDVNGANPILNQFNASHTCFQQLGVDTVYGVPITWALDRSTNLLWHYSGSFTADSWDNVEATRLKQAKDWNGNVNPTYGIPSLDMLKHLTTYSVTGFDSGGGYDNPLDFLAKYGGIDHPFGQLAEGGFQGSTNRFWASDTRTASTGDIGTTLHAAWDFGTASTKWNCHSGDYDCDGFSHSDWEPVPDQFGRADFLWFRPLAAGEGPYFFSS